MSSATAHILICPAPRAGGHLCAAPDPWSANITLSLDGRVAGRGGPHDMGWIVPHAITEGAHDHMLRVTRPATTALLGRNNYEGFAGFWPSVAANPEADPKDREFSR